MSISYFVSSTPSLHPNEAPNVFSTPRRDAQEIAEMVQQLNQKREGSLGSIIEAEQRRCQLWDETYGEWRIGKS